MISALTHLVRVLSALSCAAALGLAWSAPAPASAAPTPTCFGRVATIVGTSGGDKIVGTAGDDVIDAGGGSDKISGGGGDDLICGRDGADTIYGGPGNDYINGGRGVLHENDPTLYQGDTIDGGIGDDYIDPGLDSRPHEDNGRGDLVTYASATGPVHVDTDVENYIGTVDAREGNRGADRIFLDHELDLRGSGYDDTMTGGSRDDVFEGNGGSDTLLGGAGDDLLFDGTREHPDDPDLSGPADDRDVFSGGAGDDQVFAVASDRAGPLGHHEKIDGGPGNDRIDAPDSAVDQLRGGAGDDSMFYAISPNSVQHVDAGPGVDYVHPDGTYIGAAAVQLDLEAGAMTVDSGSGTYVSDFTGVEAPRVAIDGPLTIAGTEADDVLGNGSVARALTLIGRGGDDELFGGPGDDHLDGGPGSDTGHPYRGTDTCVSIEVTTPGDRCEINR